MFRNFKSSHRFKIPDRRCAPSGMPNDDKRGVFYLSYRHSAISSAVGHALIIA
jgi:hypothetical protein